MFIEKKEGREHKFLCGAGNSKMERIMFQMVKDSTIQ
jgi:hypothetical protein